MKAILASTTAELMYRGTEYTSRWQILQEDGVTPLPLSGNETLKMRLARSYTEPSLLEISGIIIDKAEGKVAFTFQPADTTDLLAIAHDRTVLVNGAVVAQDRFGILAQNQEVPAL